MNLAQGRRANQRKSFKPQPLVLLSARNRSENTWCASSWPLMAKGGGSTQAEKPFDLWCPAGATGSRPRDKNNPFPNPMPQQNQRRASVRSLRKTRSPELQNDREKRKPKLGAESATYGSPLRKISGPTYRMKTNNQEWTYATTGTAIVDPQGFARRWVARAFVCGSINVDDFPLCKENTGGKAGSFRSVATVSGRGWSGHSVLFLPAIHVQRGCETLQVPGDSAPPWDQNAGSKPVCPIGLSIAFLGPMVRVSARQTHPTRVIFYLGGCHQLNQETFHDATGSILLPPCWFHIRREAEMGRVLMRLCGGSWNRSNLPPFPLQFEPPSGPMFVVRRVTHLLINAILSFSLPATQSSQIPFPGLPPRTRFLDHWHIVAQIRAPSQHCVGATCTGFRPGCLGSSIASITTQNNHEPAPLTELKTEGHFFTLWRSKAPLQNSSQFLEIEAHHQRY